MGDQAQETPPAAEADKQKAGQVNDDYKPLQTKQLIVTLYRSAGPPVAFSVQHHAASFAASLQCLLVMNPAWFVRFTIVDGETREILIDCDMPTVAKSVVPMLPPLPEQKIMPASVIPKQPGRR